MEKQGFTSDEAKSNSIYPDATAPQMPTPPSYDPNMGHAPQQQPQYPQGSTAPPGQPTTVVYVADCGTYGPKSMRVTCPNCHEMVQTRVEYTSGLLSWLLCGGCLLFGCWLGCCLIPFCVDDCKDAEHFCPNCKQYLGQYKRIG